MSASEISNPYRVLIIEDEDSIRDLMIECLAEDNYHVLPSDHVLDLSDVLQLRPDLILLDLILAGKHVGWDYVRTLKSMPCTARIPILVCSGDYPFADHASAEQLASITGMLIKPLDIQHFLDSMESSIRYGHTMWVPAPVKRSTQQIGSRPAGGRGMKGQAQKRKSARS